MLPVGAQHVRVTLNESLRESTVRSVGIFGGLQSVLEKTLRIFQCWETFTFGKCEFYKISTFLLVSKGLCSALSCSFRLVKGKKVSPKFSEHCIRRRSDIFLFQWHVFKRKCSKELRCVRWIECCSIEEISIHAWSPFFSLNCTHASLKQALFFHNSDLLFDG